MKKIFSLLLVLSLLMGCGHQSVDADNSEVNSSEITEADSDTGGEALQSFLLYYGDDQAENFLNKEIQITEITAEAVVAQLVAEKAVPEGTYVNDFSDYDGVLHIDFNDVFQNYLYSMGTAGEWMLIGSVVNTFLDAFGGQSVLITVNGNTLESGHNIYDTPIEFIE